MRGVEHVQPCLDLPYSTFVGQSANLAPPIRQSVRLESIAGKNYGPSSARGMRVTVGKKKGGKSTAEISKVGCARARISNADGTWSGNKVKKCYLPLGSGFPIAHFFSPMVLFRSPSKSLQGRHSSPCVVLVWKYVSVPLLLSSPFLSFFFPLFSR